MFLIKSVDSRGSYFSSAGCDQCVIGYPSAETAVGDFTKSSKMFRSRERYHCEAFSCVLRNLQCGFGRDAERRRNAGKNGIELRQRVCGAGTSTCVCGGQ